jgi:phage major head subunit gpT-like protein
MATTVSVMNTGAFSQLISHDYKKVTFDEFKRYPEMYRAVANIKTMDSAYEREGQIVGLGALHKIYENQPIEVEAFLQGNSKLYEPEDFALMIQISRNMYDDDLTGHMKKAFQELGKSAAYTRELKFWDLLNSAFVTTSKIGIDSAALCSLHTLFGSGGTFANYAATPGGLNMTTLAAARLSFHKMVNDKGIPIPMEPSLLIVSPELEAEAEKIVKTKYNPENANMQYNVFNGLQYMVVPFKTSTTSWFLVGKKGDHDLQFRIRMPFQMESSDDFHTRTALFRGVMRISSDFGEWRGVYGNAGA